MRKLSMFMVTAMGLIAYSTNAQNIGIGTVTPTRARLELHGGVGRTAAIFGGEGPGISIQKEFPAVGYNQYFDGASSRYIGNGFAAVTWFNPGLGILNFDMFPNGAANAVAAGSRVMSITSTGHVGIGNAATNGQLQLNNEVRNRKFVLYQTVNNDHQYYGFGIENGALRYSVDAPGAAHRFYAGNNSVSSNFLMSIGGNRKVMVGGQAQGFRVGINSGDPVYTLEVVQAAGTGVILVNPDLGYSSWEHRVVLYSQGTTCLLLRYNESITQGWFRPDTGGYSAQSDERKKKNIHNLEPVLDRVKLLRPARYQMRENNQGERETFGLIAQELKSQFPELVDVVQVPIDSTNKIADHHGVDYGALSVIAIRAIQEQQEIITKLQKEMNELKEQNKKLMMDKKAAN
jgi:hypothetical protein